MSDFTAKITAELDTSNIQAEINKIAQNKLNISVDTSNIRSQIEKTLKTPFKITVDSSASNSSKGVNSAKLNTASYGSVALTNSQLRQIETARQKSLIRTNEYETKSNQKVQESKLKNIDKIEAAQKASNIRVNEALRKQEIKDNARRERELAAETKRLQRQQEKINKLTDPSSAQERVYGSAYKSEYDYYLANGNSVESAKKAGFAAVKRQKTGEVIKAIDDMTSSATRYVALPIAAVTAASVKAFMDYETAFMGVRKTVEGTDEELQAISDGLEEMALRVPVASVELANIAKIGGQLGIPTKSLLKFTETFAGLETATNLQGEEGASTLARLMNVVGEDYDNIENVGSAIVDLGNNFATTESEIVKMSQRLGKTGSIVGMSTADILGYSAALSSVGIQAELGGSAMTRIWQNISQSVSTGGEDLKAFAKVSKMSAKDFAKAWKTDPTKAFNSLLKGLNESPDIIADLDKLGINNVRDIQTMQGLAKGYDIVTEALERSNSAYKENVALANEANRAYSTTASKLQIAKESIVQAGRSIGEAVAPTLIDLAEGVKNVAQGFANLDEGTQKTIANTGLAIAGLIAGVNGISKIAGMFNTISGAFSKLKGLIKPLISNSFPGLAKALSTISPQAVAVAAGLTAIAVAVKKIKENSDKSKVGETLKKDIQEVKKHSSQIVKLNDLMGEVQELELIIETPSSTQEQIDSAKARLEEIAAILEKEYDLKIKSDSDSLEKTLKLLTTNETSEMVDKADEYIEELGTLDYTGAKKGLASKKKKAEKLGGLLDDLEQIQSWNKEINKIKDSDIRDSEKFKLQQEAKKVYGELEKLGYGTDVIHGYKEGYYGEDAVTLGQIYSDLYNSTDEDDLGINKREEIIGNHEETTFEAVNALTQSLASSMSRGDNFNSRKIIRTFENLGKQLQKEGYNTDFMAKEFAISSQGVLDLNSAIKNEKLNDVIHDYIEFKEVIGDTADNAVRGAALLENGLTAPIQVTSENIETLYDSMKRLGEENGVEDAAKNAVEGTAMYASGFNSIQEVIDSGNKGISSFLTNVNKLNEIDGIFTADMNIDEKSQKLTNFAHELGLIPDNKSVKIDVDTGEVSIITDVTKQINEIWDGGNKTLNVKVNKDGIDGISELKDDIDALDNKDCKITFNADGSPARAVIGDLNLELTDYDSKTGTATLYAEDKGAIGTINLVTGMIDLLPSEKIIEIKASAVDWKNDGGFGDIISNILGGLDPNEEISFSIGANGDIAVLNEAKEVIGVLNSQDKNIEFKVGVNGNLEIINKLTGETGTLDKEGNIVFNVDTSKVDGYSAPDKPGTAPYSVDDSEVEDYEAPDKPGTAPYEVDDSEVQSYKAPNKPGTAPYSVNSSAVDAWQSPSKPGTAPYSPDPSAVNAWKPPTKYGTVIYKKVWSSGRDSEGRTLASVDGTAHAEGTAFAGGNARRGDWGTKGSGIALGGELGEELIVRNGKFFTIGSDSAEFFAYRKGDIIFNAEQTKQIFGKGKITHGNRRGKAFAQGTGTEYIAHNAQNGRSEVIEKMDKIQESQNKTALEKEKEKEEELAKVRQEAEDRRKEQLDEYLDKSERLYKVHQNETKYIKDLEHAYGNLASTEEERLDIADEIEQAYKDLSANIIKDIEHDIDMILRTDPNADVKSYYKKIQAEAHREAERLRSLGYADNSDEIQEQQRIWWDANEEIQNAYQQSIIERYDKILAEIESKANSIDAKMQKSEAKGMLASTRYYSSMSKIEQENLEQLRNEHNELINTLNSSLENGEIAEYSEAWYTLKTDINSVTEAILDSENALADYNNQMRQITWDRFNYAQDSLSKLTNEADFLIGLLGDDFYIDDAEKVSEIISDMKENSSDWWSSSSYGRKLLEQDNIDKAKEISEILGKDVLKDKGGIWRIGNQELYSYKNGNLNDSGMAAMGLHGLKYNVYMEQSLAYEKELAKIESDLANNPYDTNLIARKQELLELQRESILVAQDEKQAIRDMVEEGISVELDALQKLIDKYNESLDSAKDLYDYQQSIVEHTDNIASIQKQLSAYENDSSEETKAKIQQLKVDLEAAEKDLRDAEYNKYISDQKELLDNIYSEYEETLNKRLNNVDELVSNMLDSINSNSSSINSTLISETEKVGTKISKDMNTIWTSENTALNNYLNSEGSLIGGFTLAANGYFSSTSLEISGINTTLSSILDGVNTIMEYSSIIAQAETDPDGTKNKMIQNSLDWWASSDSNERASLSNKNELYGEALGYSKINGFWYDSNGNLAYSISDDDKIRNVIAKMKTNSANWSSASASERKRLEQENETYANKIESLTGKSVYKDSAGVWWIDDKKLYSYKTGGLANFTGAAWLDGTPSKPELVLNAQDTKNFIALKDTLRTMSEQGLSLSSMGYSNIEAINQLSKLNSMSDVLSRIRNQNSGNNKTIGDISISIPIEHVDNYNDFITQLQKDKQFEKFVRSVSVDMLSGGSSLVKNKYKW